MSDFTKLEYCLLSQDVCEGINEPLLVALNQFCRGEYGQILKAEFANPLFAEDAGEITTDVRKLVKKNVDKLFTVSLEEKEELVRELRVLLVAVSCLQLFVQNNWVGPSPSDVTPKHFLPESMYTESQAKSVRDQVEAGLSVDGEPVYTLTRYPEFLAIARVLLLDCRDRLTHLQTVDWWALRCISLQQQILDDKSSTLREAALNLMQTLQTIEPLMTDDKYRGLQMQFHLECGNMCHMFYGYREASAHYNTARKISNLTVELTGVMGKRTRFQQTNKAQLALLVTRDGDGGKAESDTRITLPPSLPKNLNLDDDTVLDQINFEEEEMPVALSPTEQALVLGLMEEHRRSKAAEDTLIEEEVQAYLSYVLNQVKVWSVSVSALLLRSKLEKKSSRRIDRSMRQLEELYNQTQRVVPPAGQRMDLFYTLGICPTWDVQKQLAEILIALGAIGSALTIYEQLEMWEEAITCYQRMGKTEKAETVIRDQLAVKETPNLWCFLGDVTGKMEHYERAWELSNHRSGRAQRCMGYLYMRKENFEKCLECFQKSLSINALQTPVWFTYGCAAMAAQNHPLAIKAFKRCVAIDYDNFEAWNNLASSFIKIGEKKMAFLALGDALKCMYHNWRIWENYMLVATDIGEFSQSIRAYNMLMELKDKWTDAEVLALLVRAVTEKLPTADGRTGEYLEPELRKLFGRVTAKVTDKAEVWRLYAKISANDLDKSLQCLQKAHRCVMQTSDWEKDVKQCSHITTQSLDLADTYSQCSSQTGNATQSIQLLSSAKLMLRGVLSKIKQQHTDPITQEIPSDVIRELCSSLEEKMKTTVDKITEMKGT